MGIQNILIFFILGRINRIPAGILLLVLIILHVLLCLLLVLVSAQLFKETWFVTLVLLNIVVLFASTTLTFLILVLCQFQHILEIF